MNNAEQTTAIKELQDSVAGLRAAVDALTKNTPQAGDFEKTTREIRDQFDALAKRVSDVGADVQETKALAERAADDQAERLAVTGNSFAGPELRFLRNLFSTYHRAELTDFESRHGVALFSERPAAETDPA